MAPNLQSLLRMHGLWQLYKAINYRDEGISLRGIIPVYKGALGCCIHRYPSICDKSSSSSPIML